MNTADGFEQAAISAVAASQGERLEETRDAVILDRTIVAAGFMAKAIALMRIQPGGISFFTDD